MADRTPWGTPVGPAVTGGAYPRTLWHRVEPVAAGSAADLLGPDPRLEVETDPDRPRRLRCDVVVVGSGAGGAVVAKELAETGARVVVLEEGGPATREDFTGPPIARFQRFARDAGTTMIWGRPVIPLPLGQVVGGSTVVNSGTCWRAPDRVLRSWGSRFGLPDLDPEAMRPRFERVEHLLNVRPVPWDLLGRNAETTHRGVRALGLSGGPLLRNITDCHGCGTCAMGCPTNAKQAMHISYLPLAQRAGAAIQGFARAERIVVEDGRARGVAASILDPSTGRVRGTLSVEADVVVVAAGTVHTPVLLHRSGVGGASGQLGRNLRIHPAVGVVGRYPEEIRSWRGTLQSYFVDALFDSHDVMLETTAAVPAVATGSLRGIGREAKDLLADLPRVASIGLYVSDTSSGRVRVLPGVREPVLTYRLNDVDLRKLLAGIRLAAEIHLAAGATAVLTPIARLGEISSRDDLERVTEGPWGPGDLRPTAFHPQGTARMGPPGRGVVDAWGRMHGVEGAWVADGSVFPSCVGVNPQEPIMAFATRTAEAISGSGGRR